MSTAYPPDGGKTTPTPEQFDQFRQSLGKRLVEVSFVRTSYGLDRQLGIPVTLTKVITDTYWDHTTVDDIVSAYMLYPELMDMDFVEAMEMPITMTNGPIKTALGHHHDSFWKPEERRSVIKALSDRYREGMNARHPRETQ